MRTLIASAACAATLNLAGFPAAANAAEPRLTCTFVVMPIPGGGAAPIPVSCCDLDAMLPTCWGSEDQPVPALTAPEPSSPGPVSPHRMVDQPPLRELPNDGQDIVPRWPDY